MSYYLLEYGLIDSWKYITFIFFPVLLCHVLEAAFVLFLLQQRKTLVSLLRFFDRLKLLQRHLPSGIASHFSNKHSLQVKIVIAYSSSFIILQKSITLYRLRLGCGIDDRGLISAGDGDFFRHKDWTGFWAHSAWYPPTGTKLPEREANH